MAAKLKRAVMKPSRLLIPAPIHGFPILFGNTAAAARFLESVGFENALFWAYVAGVVEFVCGVCLGRSMR